MTEESNKRKIDEINIKIDTDKMKAEMKHLVEIEFENKILKESLDKSASEKAELEDQLSKHGGKGTIPLTTLQIQPETVFEADTLQEAHEKMIDYLRVKGDNETLNKLWKKSIQGIREQPTKALNWEYSPTKEQTLETSSVQKALQIQNKKYRERFGFKE